MSSRSLLHWLAAALLLCAAAAAWAAAGVVTNLSGTVHVQRADGTVRLLGIGSELDQGDLVSTERDTYLQVKFSDGSQVTLRPGTRVLVQRYSFEDASPGGDNMVLQLVKGGLRSITGLIGRRGNRDAFKMHSETATIGIRGTDFTAIEVPPPSAGGAGELPPGLYVTVADGAVVLTSGGVPQLVNAGDTGFSAAMNLPPQLIPRPPALPRVAPPGGFTQGPDTSINAGASQDCIVQ